MQIEHDLETPRYTCPMHPEVQEDQPGNCPTCGMPLEAREEGQQGKAREHQDTGRRMYNRQDEMRERGAPTQGDPSEMVRKMRSPWLWTNFTVITLGLWLITSPATFGYENLAQVGERVVRITAERSLPPLAFRGAALTWSDIVSGILLVLFGTLSLWPHPRTDFFGRWSVCFVGIWLQFAPLVFWSPSPTVYANDTLVGALVITLSVLVPMMPGMAHHMAMMKPGPDIPPGWSYNPSSWLQRGPIIALAFIGWFISRYLAAYQLGYIPSAWDPLFGGTRTILDSKVSRSWPISDAGLGAVAYTIEVLMGFMGGVSRWRTMPWMVSFFGILVVPLGLTSIILVILQPVAVGTWCTLCLVTALAMLIMIPLTVDEVVATCQFLVQALREGKPFWRTFWVGDTVEGGAKDARTPHYGTRLAQAASAMTWGVTVPWRLLVSAALGLWLMAAPAVFKTSGVAADSDHLVGALAVTTAVIVTAEVVRAGRFLNVLFGVWVIVAPWLFSGASAGARVNDVITGVAVILLSFRRCMVHERYGTWDRYIV